MLAGITLRPPRGHWPLRGEATSRGLCWEHTRHVASCLSTTAMPLDGARSPSVAGGWLPCHFRPGHPHSPWHIHL